MTGLSALFIAAGLLALLFVGLSGVIVYHRFTRRVSLGDGGDKLGTDGLKIAIRAHGNFAEYVPFSLGLVGLVGWAGGGGLLVELLAAALVLSRYSHAYGMYMPAPNPFRAGGIIVNWAIIALSGLYLLLHAV